jgi:hypothetical protein
LKRNELQMRAGRLACLPLTSWRLNQFAGKVGSKPAPHRNG